MRVFDLRLSRSAEVAKELLGEAFAGILNCDRYGGSNVLSLLQRQFCWAHLRRDPIAMTERRGVSREIGQALLAFQEELFSLWHAWQDRRISRLAMEAAATDIRQAFQAKLEWAVNLGVSPGETTPLARTLGTCRALLTNVTALWTFLAHPDVEPTNNATADDVCPGDIRALRSAVIGRKLSLGVPSEWGGQLVVRLLSVTTSLEQQGRAVMDFLMELMVAHREGRPLPSLIPLTG